MKTTDNLHVVYVVILDSLNYSSAKIAKSGYVKYLLNGR